MRGWSAEELRILEDNAHLGGAALVKLLGRKRTAIKSMARSRDIKIGRLSVWSEHEAATLRRMAATSYLDDIAKAIGRTTKAVRHKARLLGLKLRPTPPPIPQTPPKRPPRADHNMALAVKLYNTGLSPRAVQRAMPKGECSDIVGIRLRAMIAAGQLERHPPKVKAPLRAPAPCKEPGCTRMASSVEHGLCSLHRKLSQAGACPFSTERLAELYAQHPTVSAAAKAERVDREVLRYWMRRGGVQFLSGRVATKAELEQREEEDRQWLAEKHAAEARQVRERERRQRLLREQLPQLEIDVMNRLLRNRIPATDEFSDVD